MTTNKKISEEFSKGNFEFAYDHFSSSIKWKIVGGHTIKGRKKMIEACDKMTAEMNSSQLANTNIVMDQNNIAIEGTCNYTNADNRLAQVSYCDVYRFEKGKIKEITSYCINSVK